MRDHYKSGTFVTILLDNIIGSSTLAVAQIGKNKFCV